LAPEWLFTGVVLLVMYYFTDRIFFKKEPWQNISAELREIKPLKIGGAVNFLFVGCYSVRCLYQPTYIPQMAETDAPMWIKYLRERSSCYY
jgi:hypothetical protein